jgi:hypothetical protein
VSATAPPALSNREEERWERVMQGGVWLLDPERDARLIQHLEMSGHVYFVGRLGGIRVLILENTRAESEADGTHTLLFGEATPPASRPSDPFPACAAERNRKPA